MKQKRLALSLALVMALALALSACGGSSDDGKLAGGTWTESTETISDMATFIAGYRADDIKGPVPADWTLPEEVTVGENTRIEISGDKILYGEYNDEGLMDGFTVATYADGTLTRTYEFKSGVVRSWQRFFSPDGTKLVAVWAKDADGAAWNVTLVDLTTGGESQLEVPEMTFTVRNQETGEEETKTAEFLLPKWQDDSTLVLTGCPKEFNDEVQPITYLYTLPAA